jgi:hypothetical protein
MERVDVEVYTDNGDGVYIVLRHDEKIVYAAEGLEYQIDGIRRRSAENNGYLPTGHPVDGINLYALMATFHTPKEVGDWDSWENGAGAYCTEEYLKEITTEVVNSGWSTLEATITVYL